MFDQEIFEEVFDTDPYAWAAEEEFWAEQEGLAGVEINAYPVSSWQESDFDIEADSLYNLDQPAEGIGAWPKFLFVATILACLCVAGILSFISFDITSAGSRPLSAESISAASNAASLEEASYDYLGQPSALAQTDIECQVSEQFPTRIRQWCEVITRNASKRGLPANLVAALILQESGGNPGAYSQNGAVGLMQVMPSDGIAASFACVNGPCFANRPSTSQLQNPEFNIAYGTKMLAGLLGRQGSLREALKSYGPMNVGYSYADKVLGIYQRYGR